MEAYRDQYATLFNNGRKVVVLGLSVDPDTMLYSWAKDADFPMLFGADPGGKIGQAYGAYNEQNKMDTRALYIVSPEGKITYKTPNFRVLAQDAYDELAAEVDKLSPPPPAKGSH
jgi:peroxiredoxin